MANMQETKKTMLMHSIEWNISDAKEEVEKAKAAIERELQNFNEVTSPMWIAKYGKEMQEATEKRKMYEEQLKKINWLFAEQ